MLMCHTVIGFLQVNEKPRDRYCGKADVAEPLLVYCGLYIALSGAKMVRTTPQIYQSHSKQGWTSLLEGSRVGTCSDVIVHGVTARRHLLLTECIVKLRCSTFIMTRTLNNLRPVSDMHGKSDLKVAYMK